ncbi:hypothetical protein GPA27_21310 [Aromatoleum toluolicum]|uniref:Uncharacterized protein n=1 Tax=Aromatoleum toluolicum TaxID=90060 RepID=A0ABX1NKP9_9RHOO|nr:hypothetical protein [Aromatoleum toluolicum]NMF99916.1 hypothetical protein [Aromatoleum toluolicum]
MTKRKVPTREARPDPDKEAKNRADVATHAETMTAVAALRFAGVVGEQDPQTLVAEMTDRIKAVVGGDMREPERMLMGQAIALQAIFSSLANRAAINMGEYPQTVERYMRLALKAQSQCRATLETLAVIKNPPVVFAKQANVTTGPQQINNGITVPARAGETQSEPNKLYRGARWAMDGRRNGERGKRS